MRVVSPTSAPQGHQHSAHTCQLPKARGVIISFILQPMFPERREGQLVATRFAQPQMSSLSHLVLTHWKTGDCRPGHKLSPISWDPVLPFLLLQRKRQMQSQQSLVIREGKRQEFISQRKATKFHSQSKSFLGKLCMHFPSTSTPGHTVGKQLISQLQSLSSCVLELAGFTVSQPVLGPRQPLWPQPLPSLLRCAALPPSWFQRHIFTRTSVTHPATDHFQSGSKHSTNFLQV